MKKNRDEKSNKKKIIIVSFILLLIIGLMIYAENFRNFSSIYLMKNKKEMLDINDLVVGDIKYLDNEKKVNSVLGKPSTESTKIIGNYQYKIKKYDGLIVTMKENYDDFVVVKIELTSKKYKTGRNIKIGDGITKVLRNYRVDNSRGTYMYGNSKIDALNDKSLTKTLYTGYRDKEKVEYAVRDSISDRNSPVLIERITYEYTRGKIKKITWSYDVE